jgi:hypothetical protein
MTKRHSRERILRTSLRREKKKKREGWGKTNERGKEDGSLEQRTNATTECRNCVHTPWHVSRALQQPAVRC